MLDKFCAEGGFEPDVTYTAQETAVGHALVAAGLCVAIMGEHTVPRPRPGVVVRPLPGQQNPKRTILAATLQNRRMPAVKPMLELLREEATQWMSAATRS